MAISGKETLSYEAVTEIRNNIITIKDDISAQFEALKRIYSEIEQEGIFVTDEGSKAAQADFAQYATTFEPFITKLSQYADFLSNQLTSEFTSADTSAASAFANVANNLTNK